MSESQNRMPAVSPSDRIAEACRVPHGLLLRGALILVALSMSIAVTSSASAAGEPKVLLLPFVVHSAEDPAYVRGGLADMLSARFNRIGAVDLVREEDAEKGTSSLQTALATARKAGADYVLFGSFTRFGKGASLDVQCAPTQAGRSQEPLREIFVHSGSIGEIIPDLDELAGKVSRFARGEIVDPGPAAPAAGTRAVPSRDVSDLTRRIEQIETAIESLRATVEGAATVAGQ